ncbi:MAG: hypothetical protein ACYS6K_24600, partial [Planctomycetota bacterium]
MSMHDVVMGLDTLIQVLETFHSRTFEPVLREYSEVQKVHQTVQIKIADRVRMSRVAAGPRRVPKQLDRVAGQDAIVVHKQDNIIALIRFAR